MKLNIVPARTGATWVRNGIRTFFRQPLALAGLFFMFMMAVSFLGMVPVLGAVLALSLLPAATLGLMAATAEAEKGKFPMPALLIAGFRASADRRRSLVVLGGIYAASVVAILLASGLVDGGGFAKLYMAGGKIDAQTVNAPGFQTAVWFTVVLYMPLSMLFWHAPALVYWHGVTPLKSLFFSFIACWSSWRAYLVFGLAWVFVLFLGFLVLVVLASLDQAIALNAAVPLALLMSSMFFSSIYFTYRDSFSQETPHEQAPS